MNMPDSIQEGGAGKGHWAAKQKGIEEAVKSNKKGDFELTKNSDMFKLLKS